VAEKSLPSLPSIGFLAGQQKELGKLKQAGEAAAAAAGFIPRLDLDKDTGQFRFGVDAIEVGQPAPVKDQSFELPGILGPYRFHAVVFAGPQVVKESYGGPGEAVYDEIAKMESALKGQKDGPRPYAGVDFLVYVYQLEKFATLWFKGTAMRDIDEVGKLQGSWVRIFSKHVQQKATGNEWHVPKVEGLDPATARRLFSGAEPVLPAELDYDRVLHEFNHPIVRLAPGAADAAKAPEGERPR
jgi:hypothetical protein